MDQDNARSCVIGPEAAFVFLASDLASKRLACELHGGISHDAIRAQATDMENGPLVVLLVSLAVDVVVEGVVDLPLDEYSPGVNGPQAIDCAAVALARLEHECVSPQQQV